MKTENLAIVFVDIVGFTPRTSSQSRSENELMLKRFADLVRPLVRAFNGKVVKTLGDAFLLTFRSPTDALHCAMAVHDGLAESDRTVPEGDRFQVRAAINVGEVRIEKGDIFGEAVNIAARIEGVADAGEIVFSEAVYLSMTKSEVPSEEMGARELKGIPEPVRLYRVPRVDEVGGYTLTGSGAGPQAGDVETGTTADKLVPVAFPFGGSALGRARARAPAAGELATEIARQAGDVATTLGGRIRPLMQEGVRRWKSSTRFRIVALVIAAIIVGGASWAMWPQSSRKRAKPRKKDPVERLRDQFGF